jgi:hypothetical protein
VELRNLDDRKSFSNYQLPITENLSMQAGISVLVCSFNGSQRLPETLAHLAAQECPAEIQWELIVS